jgi:1,4-dihydroxy-2-naphthoate octaprenyltransferase
MLSEETRLPAPAMSAWRIWWMASRPRTLPAAVAPVIVGTAIAFKAGHFAPGPAAAALVGALLLQLASNYANDYFDWKNGADTAERQGPTRVMASGLVTPRQIQGATAIAIGLALLIGAYLIAVGGWPIAALGVASIIAAVAYTGGPYPLGYLGLGEAMVFVFFGLGAVMGTYYVQALGLSPLAAWLAVPMGAWAAGILVVNNVRDAATDAQCGKGTLAVRLGVGFAKALYVALMAIGFAVPAALAASGAMGWGGYLPLLAAPLAWPLVRSVYTESGPALNRTLGGTARLLLVGAALLAVGVLV